MACRCWRCGVVLPEGLECYLQEDADFEMPLCEQCLEIMEGIGVESQDF